MKADYMRYIYECLSGENGLLYGVNTKHDFADLIRYRIDLNISEQDDELHVERAKNLRYGVTYQKDPVRPATNHYTYTIESRAEREMTFLEYF